jgi:hypothetical protein
MRLLGCVVACQTDFSGSDCLQHALHVMQLGPGALLEPFEACVCARLLGSELPLQLHVERLSVRLRG